MDDFMKACVMNVPSNMIFNLKIILLGDSGIIGNGPTGRVNEHGAR